jgi:hypothetical protein
VNPIPRLVYKNYSAYVSNQLIYILDLSTVIIVAQSLALITFIKYFPYLVNFDTTLHFISDDSKPIAGKDMDSLTYEVYINSIRRGMKLIYDPKDDGFCGADSLIHMGHNI